MRGVADRAATVPRGTVSAPIGSRSRIVAALPCSFGQSTTPRRCGSSQQRVSTRFTRAVRTSPGPSSTRSLLHLAAERAPAVQRVGAPTSRGQCSSRAPTTVRRPTVCSRRAREGASGVHRPVVRRGAARSVRRPPQGGEQRVRPAARRVSSSGRHCCSATLELGLRSVTVGRRRSCGCARSPRLRRWLTRAAAGVDRRHPGSDHIGRRRWC